MALSYIEYTGDGGQIQYTTPPHIDPAHIYVALGGTIIASSNYSIEGTTLTFTTAPVLDTLIRIGRKTSQETRLTDYQDASLLTADALDRDANQLFYMAQEAIDTASETNIASSTFYSATTTPPDTANLGDLWYDAANKYLKIYNGTQWDLATPSNETFTYEYAVFDNTETGLTYINVANLNLDVFVFLNGVKQVRADSKANLTAASGAKDFFVDLDNSRVYFAQLSANDIVQVILAASDIGTNNHTQLETYTATANQTVFTLTNSYIPTTNTLSVYVNGVRQSAYTETNATTVTFTNGLTAGDEVVFITNQYQTAQGFTAADNVTYTPVGSSSASTVKAALDDLNSDITTINSNAVPKPNLLINGGFDFWQRGTSFTTPNAWYSADRWISTHVLSSGSITTSKNTFAVGQTVTGDSTNYLKIAGTSAISSNNTSVILAQFIEGVETLEGKTATLSFWAKTSNVSGRQLGVEVYQNFGNGATASTDVFVMGQQTDITNTWTQYTFTFDVDSINGKTIDGVSHLGLNIFAVAKGTSASGKGWTEIPDLGNDALEITQVKLEEGSNFTGWPQTDYSTELAKCQRYFFKQIVRVPTVYDAGLSLNRSIVVFPVVMRAHANFNVLTYTAQGHNTNNTQPTVYANNVYGGIDIGSTDQAYRQYGHHTLVTVTADAEL